MWPALWLSLWPELGDGGGWRPPLLLSLLPPEQASRGSVCGSRLEQAEFLRPSPLITLPLVGVSGG